MQRYKKYSNYKGVGVLFVTLHYNPTFIKNNAMTKVFTSFDNDNDARRDELIRTIEHSVERLTLGELESLYYDLVSKDYIRK